MKESLPLTEIIKQTKKREISFTELADFYLKRIADRDTEIHAFLAVDEEGVRAKAQQNDNNHDAGKDRPLNGIPYAVKDNILVKGHTCTAASRMLQNYTAPYDATAIANLQQAGAVVLGKTNLDEYAMGSSTETSAFGPTKNPLDTTRVPGGSSGGSAAAVAAGMAPFALGSDTAGSVRQPAAFCGVVGFKPTYGAVSRHGLIAMASSFDQIGTLTRTVADAQLIFGHLATPDVMDSTSSTINPSRKRTKKPTIGILKEYFGEGLDKRIRKVLDEAIKQYEQMGVVVREVSLPHAPLALAVYYTVMPSEVSSNLARYDGIRYGYRLDPEKEGTLSEDYLTIRGEAFGREVRKRIMLGTYALSSGYYDAYYLKAQKVRRLINDDFTTAFNEVDVMVAPTTPTLPFKLGEKTKDSLTMYLSDIYTVGANLAGLPAISIPAGTVEEGGIDLPVGLQIIGPQKQDYAVLEIASWLEQDQPTVPKT